MAAPSHLPPPPPATMHDHYWVIEASQGQSIGFESADELHARCNGWSVVTQDRGAMRLRLGFTTFEASSIVPLFKKRAPGHPGLFRSSVACGDRTRRAERCSVGAAVTAAEERPEPIVQTNFEHLNLAAGREGVSPERPRSKREVIEFEKVILKLRRPISR